MVGIADIAEIEAEKYISVKTRRPSELVHKRSVII